MSALQDLASRLSEWKDVADYFEIPRLDREKFEKGREVQDLIGWLKERGRLASLPDALQEIGRPDLIDLSNQVSHRQSTPLFTDPSPALTILFRATTNEWTTSEGLLNAELLVTGLWGQPRDLKGSGLRRNIIFAAGIDDSVSVTNSVLRLALHGGIQRLAVDNPDLWNRRLDKLSQNCLGTKCKTWRPILRSLTQSRREGWSIDTMSPSENSIVDGLKPCEPELLAKALSDAMDMWVIQRVDATLALIFEGDASILQIEISRPFLDRMRQIWTGWQLLTKSSHLARHMLASIMTSDEVSEETGLLRSGPETLDPCILQATVFALAFEAALECQLSPQASQLPVNFELSHLDAHLVGLELVRGIQISQVTRDINWRTGIVLLTHERTPASALNHWRGLAEPGTATDFSRASEKTTAIFTQDAEFLRLLREDPSKLKKHLANQLVTVTAEAMAEGHHMPEQGQANE